MEDKRVAEAIRQVFEASGHVSAVPVFPDGTRLAPEVLAALKCGMSTALVAASEIADGHTLGVTPEQIAANMKLTAVSTYIESVVLAGAEAADEVGHGRDEE